MKKQKLVLTTLFFALLAFTNLTQADQDLSDSTPVKLMVFQPAGEFEFNLGCSKTTGYLTENSWIGTGALTYNAYTTRRSFFSISLGKTELTHKGSSFPFANNASLTVSSFSVGPHLFFYDKNDLRLGLGVGLTELIISDSGYENMQSYGAFYWALQAKYDLTKNWNVGYLTKWQNLPGRANNSSYFFEQWSHFLTVGYAFSLLGN